MNRIGVDLGGTKTEIILTTEDPLNVIDRKRVPTQKDKGYDFILNQLASLINDFQTQCQEDALIGMGIPGIIDPKTGKVKNANTTCLIGNPLRSDLETLINNQITISNDANCFTLAEALHGAGQAQNFVLGIILGTGTGGGIVKHGQVWEGRNGGGGEWGHMCLQQNGPPCWCGLNGCMEMFISGTGLQRIYHEHTQKEQTAEVIYQDYLSQDSIAIEVFHEYFQWFGQGIGSLINILDPDLIILGGGLSNLPELYTIGIDSISQHIFSDGLQTQIVKNQLGDSSGVYGAALLANG